MLTAIMTIVVLSMTILAFTVKPRNGMLLALGIPLWLIFTFLMWNQVWPAGNTYLPQAGVMVGILGTIVMVAATAMHYVDMDRSHRIPGYDEEKELNRKRIYRLTRKKSPWE
jgi:hypothetical protein